MISNFSLLILSAGFGKRMLNLTKNTPKPLLRFKNKILLGNTINFFKEIGCNEIFINTHYLHEKIDDYIKNNFNTQKIKIIYEESILGTGGGVKNIFNFTKNKKICVVNSDIFWEKNNKADILNFLNDFEEVTHCKILLSRENNFYGLKKNNGDFNIKNCIVTKWNKGNEIIFYSGCQIVTKDIFNNTKKIFPMNYVWNNLMTNNNLKGVLAESKILHIGDKNSFEYL